PQARATGVSGVLAFSGKQFVQLLEGPRDGVESMFNTLRTINDHGNTTPIVNGPIGYAECWDWSVLDIAPESLASHLLAIALTAALDGSTGHIARLTWFMVGLEGVEQGAAWGARLLETPRRSITGYP
ncbi:MAG TPA: BLUF domain-containing protein, partial [Polymorphobacter sp.]|nr:BLUF domain-containing protein [Polymorphobacter sp.]